jgi:PAS domain S-box-containing protein
LKNSKIALKGTFFLAEMENIEKQFETILDSISDGFFILDRQYNFIFINKAFERICHISRADCIGRNYWDLFPKATTYKFYTEYSKVLKDNVSVHFEEYATSLDKWVSVSAYPTDNGLTVYFTDITEERRQAMLIEEQNKRLRNIAWMLSHKFRKPVATILGLAQLFRTGTDPENDRIIKGINEAATELDEIIKDADAQTLAEDIV